MTFHGKVINLREFKFMNKTTFFIFLNCFWEFQM